MSSSGFINERLYWGKTGIPLPPLDLTATARESYAWFLKDGIAELLSEISPIEDFTGKNWSLRFGEHYVADPKISIDEAIEKGLSYEVPLKVKAYLTNKQTGQVTEQEVFLGDLPAMTDNGTFIINGIERVVVNQLVRSAGVFYSGEIDPVTGRMLYQAELRPLRGSWLEFGAARNDVLAVKIDRRRKFPITTFLRAIGLGSDEEILKHFADVDINPDHQYIASTIEKDPAKSTSEALIEIYKKMRPGDPAVLENAQALLDQMFFDSRRYSLGRVGRFKMNRRLGLDIPNDKEHHVLTKEDIIAAVRYLIGLCNGLGRVDDIDHLSNRRVRCVGELVGSNAFRVGLLRLEKAIREKMSLTQVDILITPSVLVNARPLISAVNEFFRSSQLSSILDKTNPLSEIDNLRRLSVMGTGGISRERAAFSIRDINSSQYSRVCPIRSPEGPNIGLVTYMSLFARVNDFGFLEAPYRKVVKTSDGRMKVTDEIVYLAADDEEEAYITLSEIPVDKKGFIEADRVPVRYRGEFLEASTDLVQYIDVVPRQIVGTSASLIPFVNHDETGRALMGTHMQCQAVPLLTPHSAVVGTGMESVVSGAMGRVVRAPYDGTIAYADATKVIIKPAKKGEEKLFKIKKFERTAQSTCYTQKPVVSTGQKVKEGDLLIDGPASENGELALGQNLLLAYMSYEGLGYEDAIVISDRLVREDILTSIHIEEHEATVVDTKLGPEETTRDIPNVGEEALRNLDEKGIVVVGAEVAPGDILVGKIAPKGETELTAEERLLRAIFGEKAREVRDTSLRMPHGERGTVIDVQILDRDKGDELEPGALKLIKIKVAQIRKINVGDKLAGRHGNKGVISKIVPQADMPYLADGTPVDIIISPLSVLARMNMGQLLETHLGFAAKTLGYKVALPVFEHVDEDNIVKELKEAGLPVNGKSTLYSGFTGEPYDNSVVVGVGYILKLIHMVDDKTHARATGPYSLVTQQPLGGKAQMGGQRLGEMEVWALEAHRAAYVLQEMLTIKSDDVVGRAKAFEAIVKGLDIPQALIPESFKVLVKELNSLSLDVTPVEAEVREVEDENGAKDEKFEEKVKKEAVELAVESGAEFVANEAEITKESSPMEIVEAGEKKEIEEA